jgi:hypothetical protein
MTIAELAAYLEVPRRELYLLATYREATRFPIRKIGRIWLADLDHVNKWLVECTEKNLQPLEVAKQLRAASRKRDIEAAGAPGGRSRQCKMRTP